MAATALGRKAIAQRLYLSPRTVGSDLDTAFPKLWITCRASLRDSPKAVEDDLGGP